MGVLYFPQLTNFVEYDTDSDMQATELTELNPGAVVYSKESQKAYQFINSLASPPSNGLASDTGLGYWIPLSVEYIYEDNLAITSYNLPDLDENYIWIGGTSNKQIEVLPTGILNLPLTGVTTLNLNENTLLIGNEENIATEVTPSGILNLTLTGVTTLNLTSNNLLVGNSENIAIDSTPTGDISIEQSDTSVNLTINENTINYSMLNTDINYLQRQIYAFSYMSSGGTTSYSVSIIGILLTDWPSIIPGFITNNTTAWITGCYLEDGTFNFSFNSDPGSFTIYGYIYRDVVT